jgi:glycosyltransferase involved in cell wall biosynthesis
VIDDNSIDDSLAVALNWVKINAGRFNRISVLQNRSNSGLGATRNLAFEKAETQFVLPLDVDNRLLPDCAAACLQTLRAGSAAFAYSVIGCDRELLGTVTPDPDWLPHRTRIVLIAKAAWALVGGYDNVRSGRQDFDLWCKFAERGLLGLRVPGEPLLEYRYHGVSTKTAIALKGSVDGATS